MANRPACIVCGKKKKLTKTKLGHGTIHVCSSLCQKLLTLKINGDYSPVIWVGRDDISAEETNDENMLAEEELKTVKDMEIIVLAEDMADFLWNYKDIGDEYSDSKENALESWKKNKEKEHIQTCSKLDLPLLVGNLKFNANQKHLEERLKGK